MAFSFRKKSRRMNKNDMVAEFFLHIQPLLENDQVKKLDSFIQHHCYSRLAHSLDVAYYSFVIAKLFGWDSRSMARGALLHDLYLYDRESVGKESYKGHFRSHPAVALENALKICPLNKVEEDIIKRHMWPCTITPPRYKESYLITFVDKFCAVREGLIALRNRRWNESFSRLAKTHQLSLPTALDPVA